MPLRPLVAAAILTLLSALPARSETGLFALEREGSLLVIEAQADDPTAPSLVLPGRAGPARELELTRRWTRSEGGEWSAAGRLPEGLRGLPFMHGLEPWLAELTQRPGLGPAVEIVPLRRYESNDRVALARDPLAVEVGVESPDGWHFRVTELLADGRLSVREHTSHGPARQVEESAAWTASPAWPEGASLAGAAGPPGSALVFARAPGGELLSGRFDDSGWTPLPSFRPPDGGPALGLQLGGAPAVLHAGPGALTLWRLAGIGWEQHGRLELPGADRGAWAAVTGSGADAGRLFALRAAGDGLSAWSWSEGRWSEERVPAGELASAVAPTPLEPAPGREPPGPNRRLVTVLLGCTAGLLGLLAVVLVRRRALR